MSLLNRGWINHKIMKRYYDSLPDRVVAFCVFGTRSIAVLRHETMYALHEQVRCQNSIHEVSSDVQIIEIVLKQRRNLRSEELEKLEVCCNE